MTVTTDHKRPGVLDFLDLALLHVAKRRREKFSTPESFYESFFTEHDAVRYRLDARDLWRLERLQNVCTEFLRPGELVVDVGCGLGISASFVPSSQRYIGIDPSTANIDLARRLAPTVDYRIGGMPSLPLEDGEADLAVCLEVFEHLPDDESAAEELARAVRPGGHVLISVPQTYYWASYLSLIGHYRHYGGGRLTALLDRHGFDVVHRYPMLRRLWRGYHYLYVVLRIQNELGRRLGASAPTLYDGRLYPILRDIVLKLAPRSEAREDVGGSTFVLARRRIEAHR